MEQVLIQEDGTNRRENITDWALEQFRVRYADPSITKWDIFHYIYAVLHHHEYGEHYAANPGSPLHPGFGCNGVEAAPRTAAHSVCLRPTLYPLSFRTGISR